MSEVLGAAAIIGVVFGIAMAAIAIVGMIAFVRDSARRSRALGFVYVGFSVVSGSMAVWGIAQVVGKLPLIAALPPIAVMLVFAVIFWVAASREFRRARSERPEG